MPKLTDDQIAAGKRLTEVQREAADALDDIFDAAQPDDGDPSPEIPVVSISAPQPVIEGGLAVAKVSLNRPSTETVTVSWQTRQGSAKPVTDYAEAKGTLTFASGEVEHDVAVATLGNAYDEPDERSFELILTDAMGATIGVGAATAVILDDDLPEDPPPDGDGPLAADRLFLLEPSSPITAPVFFPAGQWRGLQAIVMQVTVAQSTKIQKLAGARSSQNISGAFTIDVKDGTRGGGFWRAGLDQLHVMPNPPAFEFGKPLLVCMAWGEQAAAASIDDEMRAMLIDGPLAEVDLEGAIGAGYWNKPGTVAPTAEPVDPIAPGTLIHAAIGLKRSPTKAELEMLAERWGADVEPPPDDGEPVVSIADAAPVKAGEALRFPVALSKTSEADASAMWTVSLPGTAAGEITLPPGMTEGGVEVIGAPEGSVTVVLSDPEGCTIGRATATGTVLTSGPPPTNGKVIAPDKNATQITLDVGAADYGTWRLGFGWGANAWAPAQADTPAILRNIKALTTDVGAKIIRTWTPESNGFWSVYKGMVNAFRENGGKHHLATGFLYRGSISPEAFADGVARSIDQGAWITHVGIQNEPDGHPGNAVKSWSEMADQYRRVRARLDQHGHTNVKLVLIGFEWAHFGPSSANQEHDLLRAAGLIPGTVYAGSGHNYSDCARPSIKDRWKTLVSTETGNAGVPNVYCRSGSALTFGAECEIFHIGLTGGASDQALVFGSGQKAPWWPHYALMFGPERGVPLGTIWRRVLSSDRPSGMGEEFARAMVRSPGKNPRLQAAFGMKPDGKPWGWVGNSTQGSGANSIYVNACYAGALLQPTFRVAELAGKKGEVEVRHMGVNGVAEAPYLAGIEDGWLRTRPLQPGAMLVFRG